MTKEYKIHACYVLSILVIIIIGLSTVKWATIPGLVDYIQFALTAVALTLGILAIFYNMYSNTNFSQNVTALNIASKDVEAAASDLTGVTANLGRKIEVFPGMIERVSSQVEETQQLVKGLSEIQDLKPTGTSKEQEAIQIPASFLAITSLIGLEVLYICLLAHSRGISFNLKNLTQSISGDYDEYARGYLVAVASLGIIRAKVSRGIWNILYFNEVIANNIKFILDKKSKELDTKRGGTVREERVKKIEEYFTQS